MSQYGYRGYNYKWGRFREASSTQRPPELELEETRSFSLTAGRQTRRIEAERVFRSVIIDPFSAVVSRGRFGIPEKQRARPVLASTVLPSVIEEAEFEELRRFSTPSSRRPDRPVFSWFIGPQRREEFTTELRKFHLGADRVRPILPQHSWVLDPQVVEELTVEMRRFVAGQDRQFIRPSILQVIRPQLAEVEVGLELRRFISGQERVPLPKRVIGFWRGHAGLAGAVEIPEELRRFFLGAARAPWQRQDDNWIAGSALEAPIPIELRRFAKTSPRLFGRFIEAAAVRTPQPPETPLSLELRKFVLGQDRSDVIPADRQHRIRLPIGFWRGHAGPAGLFDLPEELRKFALGADRAPWYQQDDDWIAGSALEAPLPVELQKFLVSPDKTQYIFLEDDSWISGSLLEATLGIELQKFLLGADAKRLIDTSLSSTLSSLIIDDAPGLPIELLRFVLGDERLRGRFIEAARFIEAIRIDDAAAAAFKRVQMRKWYRITPT